MSASHYRISGPAIISFSGGRTSAFMLRQILDAHGGALPDDVRVVFANTGKERPETLRFVHECETRWGVRVWWVEYRDEAPGFEVVGLNSASRAGEPFAALIARRKYTPNAVTRFCTSELKVRPMDKLARSWGWERWNNIIGLRYDEGRRVMKALARNEEGKERFTSLMPIAKARHVKADVLAFWASQPFDLALRSYEGNCDLCFLKSRSKLETIIREQPGCASWWIEQERVGKGRFVTEYSYADLKNYVAASPSFFDYEPDDGEFDAECGLTCGGE